MIKKVFLLLALIQFIPTGKAQSYQQQRSQVLITNLLSNALIGGIGGMLHKSNTENTVKTFTRNFFKGALGGLVKYNAKYQTYYMLNPYQASIYSHFSRLCYFTGHSMVMNAAYNRQLLHTLYANYMGIDIRYSPNLPNKLQARLSLATLGSAIFFATRGYELDIYRSLEHGLLFFNAKPNSQLKQFNGQATFNCITVKNSRGVPLLDVVPHEIVHTYQLYDWFGVSSFYERRIKKTFDDNKLYKIASKYVVADYEALFMGLSYLALYRPMPNYFKNYYEFEAQHFATRQVVRR